MHQFEKRQGLADFVFLEVPDKMPAAAGGKQGDFSLRLLDPAFSEKEESVLHRFKQCFRRVCF